MDFQQAVETQLLLRGLLDLLLIGLERHDAFGCMGPPA